jgi:hypothetical protein
MTVFAASSAAGAQPELEPGMWRLTINSTTNGKADPAQDSEQCLGEELNDLAAYFTPQLEGAESEVECTPTRQPAKDRELSYRMQCRGADLTIDALTRVTIENSRHFTMSIRTDSRTSQESAIVVAKGEGRWIGACKPAGK